MKKIEITKTVPILKVVTVGEENITSEIFIAEDGKEFDKEKDCLFYEGLELVKKIPRKEIGENSWYFLRKFSDFQAVN